MSGRRYVVFPGLVRERRGEDRVLVENRVHGTRIEASADVLELLSAFETPTSLDAVLERFGLAVADVADVVRNHFLVAEDEVATLASGFLDVTRDPPVGEAVSWVDLPARAAPGAWVAFGAPVDVAAGGEGGARHGPKQVRYGLPKWLHRAPTDVALLQIDLRRKYALAGLGVFDVGDVRYSSDEPYAVFGQRIHKIVDDVCDAGMRPLMIGGDHSVSWFTLQPLLRRHKQLGVIHFDAHHDLYPVPSGKLGHMNPFEFVCREPSLAYLLQLGLRTDETLGEDEQLVDLPQVRTVTAREVADLSPADVFASVPADVPCYLSFDVDCMDPFYAPETGTHVVGGLTYRQALDLVDYAARHFPLVGADFVEVASSQSRVNGAARIAGACLAQCVLGGVPFEPMTSYVRRPRIG